jgi:hypothetical protein
MWISHALRGATRVAALLVVAGCYSYQRVGTRPIASDASVRIHYAPPRDVALSSTVHGPAVLTSVERLQGRAIATTADSVSVRVTAATDPAGQRLSLAPEATTWIVRGPATQVEVRRLSKNRTVLLGMGVSLATIVAISAASAMSGFTLGSGY